MLGLTKFQRYFFAKNVANYINGEYVQSKANKFYDVRNPVTQELLGKTPQSTEEEFNYTVAKAKEAFKTWSKVPLTSKLIFMLSPTEIYV